MLEIISIICIVLLVLYVLVQLAVSIKNDKAEENIVYPFTTSDSNIEFKSGDYIRFNIVFKNDSKNDVDDFKIKLNILNPHLVNALDTNEIMISPDIGNKFSVKKGEVFNVSKVSKMHSFLLSSYIEDSIEVEVFNRNKIVLEYDIETVIEK